MGFVLKSAFWLGIVYSAMPLGQDFVPGAGFEVGAFPCVLASEVLAERFAPPQTSYALTAAAGCALAATRLESPWFADGRLDSDAPPAPEKGSAESLTDADRRPPWMGDRRAASLGPTQSWRAGHASGYKRVANSHRERQTVDD